MALNPTALTTEIKDELQRLHALEYPESLAAILPTHEMLAEAIATKVVAHILANAVVMPTALIAPGGMAPAPVTGVGAIT